MSATKKRKKRMKEFENLKICKEREIRNVVKRNVGGGVVFYSIPERVLDVRI